MTEVVEKRFYVLRAISGKEDKVCEQLEAEMRQSDLGSYVFQVVVPKEKVVAQRGGKKITIERPLMPGYVLVEAVLVGDVEHRLRSVANVIGFLGGRTGSPEPMKRSEVERLLRRADQIAESDGEYELDVVVGDLVRVTDGAFAGCEALVEQLHESKRRLSVMVKMFGRKIPLELSFAQVTKE
ncbi:MAG: transcription termination/antitermination protein NusG [Porphyromonadaceae bacterium]|nr:transcription termination/antitermination protein NusG [Porphyromonadaceae bacterium]